MKLTDLLRTAAQVFAERNVCHHEPVIGCVASFLSDSYDERLTDIEQLQSTLARLHHLEMLFLMEHHRYDKLKQQEAGDPITADVEHLEALITVYLLQLQTLQELQKKGTLP